MKELEIEYLNLIEELLNAKNLVLIDEEIEKADLFFGPSTKGKKSKLNSKYIRLLNHLDIEALTEEEINKMKSLASLEEANKFVKETIKKVTHKDYSIEGMNKRIPSNTLVLEIILGKNTKELRGQEFIENMKKQEAFINELKKKYTRELTAQLKYPVIFYVDKDV